MAKKNRYTPVQQKILGVLLDEKPHTMAELGECLPSGDGTEGRLNQHLIPMRDILRTVDRDIIARRYKGVSYYQLVYLPYPFPTDANTKSTSQSTTCN